jgi:hypothetical protein
MVGPPDYAPDRRAIVSLADDLADRDRPPPPVDVSTIEETEDEIVDLFLRVFETASAINLDQERLRGLGGQPATDFAGLPKTDMKSMTKDDLPFVDNIPDLLGEPTPEEPLPYAAVAKAAHGPLTDVDALLDFLRTRTQYEPSCNNWPNPIIDTKNTTCETLGNFSPHRCTSRCNYINCCPVWIINDRSLVHDAPRNACWFIALKFEVALRLTLRVDAVVNAAGTAGTDLAKRLPFERVNFQSAAGAIQSSEYRGNVSL